MQAYSVMSVAPLQSAAVFVHIAEPEMSTLYERLGGMPVVQTIVDELTTRVMGDVRIRSLARLTGPDPARLGAYKRRFVEFLAEIAGGPHCYSGDDLPSAHRGLGVTGTDFDRFFVYLVQSLNALDIPQPARSELLNLFVLTKEEVVERQ